MILIRVNSLDDPINNSSNLFLEIINKRETQVILPSETEKNRAGGHRRERKRGMNIPLI